MTVISNPMVVFLLEAEMYAAVAGYRALALVVEFT
jgi:hypothetical protein